MPDYATISVGAARAALSVIRDGAEAPERMDRLVDTTHQLAYALNEKLQAESDPLRRHLPVCKEGCAFCCHQDVMASPPEVLRVVRMLREMRSPEELEKLGTELRALTARTRGLSQREWRSARIPCPMLDVSSGSCTVHDARPMACRGYNSLDVSRCIEKYETGDEKVDVVLNAVQQHSMLAVGVGLAAAARLHGLDWEWVSLTAGVAAALEDPNVVERWLTGERPLEGAHTANSRHMSGISKASVDAVVKAVQRDHPSEAPPVVRAPLASDDDARRARNKLKRARKGR